MTRWRVISGSQAQDRTLGLPVGCAAAIVVITGGYLAAGVAAFAAWQLTGDTAWVEQFFTVPGALLTIWLASIELWMCLRVTRHFVAGEPLRSAWLLISGAAVFGLAGAILVQVLGTDSKLNVLLYLTEAGSRQTVLKLALAGHALGGTFRFAFLAGGLAMALSVYRRSGFLGRLHVLDRALLVLLGIFVARNIVDVVVALRGGKHPEFWEVLGWPVDPLLWLLLGEGLVLYRSVQAMGPGLIGRCWKAFSAAIFLTSLGVVGLWANEYGYLPWPWNSVTWFVWLPASACFALAPTFQLEALESALGRRTRAGGRSGAVQAGGEGSTFR